MNPETARRMAIARPIIESGGDWTDVAEALDLPLRTVQQMGKRNGLSLSREGWGRARWRQTKAAYEARQAQRQQYAEAPPRGTTEAERERLAYLIAEGQKLAQPKAPSRRYVERPTLTPSTDHCWPSRSSGE
jgi:hypothetical protein